LGDIRNKNVLILEPQNPITTALQEEIRAQQSLTVAKLKGFRKGDVISTICRQTAKQIIAGDCFFLAKITSNAIRVGTSSVVTTYEQTKLCVFTKNPLHFSSFAGQKFMRILEKSLVDINQPDPITGMSQKQRTHLDVWGTQFSDHIISQTPVSAAAIAKAHYDVLGDVEKKSRVVLDKHLVSINEPLIIASLPAGRVLNRLESVIETTQGRFEAIKKDLDATTSQINRNTCHIADLKAQIALLWKEIRHKEQAIQTDLVKETAQKDKKARYHQALKRIKQQLITQRKAVEKQKAEYIAKSQLPQWVANLRETGIVIIDITYNLNGLNISIIDDPLIPKNKQAQMKSIEFCTTQPTLFKCTSRDLDETEMEYRAAGPYHVKIVRENMSSNTTNMGIVPMMRLATASALRGLRFSSETEGSAYIHPHAKQTRSVKTLLGWMDDAKRWQTLCAGELTPALYTAFRTQNPKYAIYAMYAWLCTCDIDDAWGERFVYFPKANEVQHQVVAATETTLLHRLSRHNKTIEIKHMHTPYDTISVYDVENRTDLLIVPILDSMSIETTIQSILSRYKKYEKEEIQPITKTPTITQKEQKQQIEQEVSVIEDTYNPVGVIQF
jgi:glycerol-3-phosphate responsive antiterminator